MLFVRCWYKEIHKSNSRCKCKGKFAFRSFLGTKFQFGKILLGIKKNRFSFLREEQNTIFRGSIRKSPWEYERNSKEQITFWYHIQNICWVSLEWKRSNLLNPINSHFLFTYFFWKIQYDTLKSFCSISFQFWR